MKTMKQWNSAFLFAIGIIMNTLRFIEPGSGFVFDYTAAEALGCAAGVLVFAFLASNHILGAGRVGALLALGAFTVAEYAPGEILFPLFALNSFAGGLCIGCAFYVFFFVMDNKERFANLIIVQAWFAVCASGIAGGKAATGFPQNIAAYILIALFIIAVFTMKTGNIHKKPAPRKEACGSENDCCPIGKNDMGVIFYVFVVYMAANAINIFALNKGNYIDHSVYSAGMLASIIVALFIMLMLGKSARHIFLIFLIGSLVSAVLLAMDGVFDAKAGSFLYGLAHPLGYIAVLFLLGAAARLTVCLKFFRIFCIVNFLVSVVLNSGVEFLFVAGEEKNSLIALGLMVAIFCALFLRYAVINEKVLESDLFLDISRMKSNNDVLENEEAAAKDRVEGLGLTPREEQIFSLMLTDMSVKQIMIELEISKGTFNFHTTNLYRKLGIQSRTELFAKYGRP